jgi:hypothetical protein
MSHGESQQPFGVRHLAGVGSYLQSFGVNTGPIFAFIGFAILFYLLFTIDLNLVKVFAIMVGTSPLWLPYILFYFFYESWLEYVRTDFRVKQGRISLEILVPQEVAKSPLAMENILSQLYQSASPDNHLQTYIDGKHPPYFSFELISTEGNVRLIVSTPQKKFKSFVENSFYSQYPGIELRELPVDYTAEIPWDPKNWIYFAIHFGKKKPDPIPILTYVDFGLDEDPKDEFKHDPMSIMLEHLAALGPGEHLWFQFIVRLHREENFKLGSLGTVKDWKDGIQEQIKKILDDAKKRSAKEDDEKGETNVMLTPLERQNIEAIERSLTKYPFHTYIRAFYAAKQGQANFDRVGHAITTFQATNNPGRNGVGFKWRTDYDWSIWQDPTGHKREHLKHEEYLKYRLRAPTDHGSILTTEELATFFHLPSSAVYTPRLNRIPSARAEPPVNLPTG